MTNDPNRKNTLDSHAADHPEIKRLSEKEKRQMEAGDEAEKSQGPERNAAQRGTGE